MAGPVIDISKFQGAHDWGGQVQPAFAAGQIGGVIIRSGFGTTSGAQVDPFLGSNQSGARSSGVPAGFYHFAYPGRSSGSTQAEGMVRCTGSLLGSEVVALDMEDETKNGRLLVPSDVGWAVEFFQRLAQLTDATQLLYVNSTTLRQFDWTPVRDLGVKLWLASFGANTGRPGVTPNPRPWPNWTLWQYTSVANLAGFSPVDASLLGQSLDSLAHLGKDAPVPSTSNQYVLQIQQALVGSGAQGLVVDGVAGPATVGALSAVLGYQQGEMTRLSDLVTALQAQVQQLSGMGQAAAGLRDNLRALLA